MIRRILFLCCIVASSLLCADMTIFDQGRAQVRFVEKVGVYVQQVRNDSKNLEDVGEILSRAALLTPHSSMKSVATLLDHLGPFLTRENDVAVQEACCASLIKAVVPIVEQFEKELFQNLHTIDRCLEYWEYQQVHPASYFFHKSPLKYFTLGQKGEVAQKLQFLKEEQQQYLALLGKINIHLSAFEVHQSVNDKHAWMQKLCMFLFSYDLAADVSTNEELFPLLSQATSVIDNYRKYAHGRLSQYRVPNALMRRWLYVVSAVAGVAYLGSYVQKNRKGLKKKVKGVKRTLKGEANRLDGIVKRAAFGDGEEAEKRLNQRYKEVVEVFQAIKTDMGEEVLSSEDCPYKDLWRDLPESIGDGVPPDSRLVGLMAEYASECTTAQATEVVDRARSGFQGAADELNRPSGILRLNPFNIKGIYGAVQRVSEGLGDDGVQGKILPQAVFLRYELMLKEYRMLLAIMELTPYAGLLSGVGFGLYMLYKKIQGVPCYDSVRAALIDIALLLNVYGDAKPEDMDVCDLGRLAYLVYKLQLEEWRLPKQYRASFLNEIGLLQTSSLTADQKMKVIDLLFKKYPFLAGQGLSVA